MSLDKEYINYAIIHHSVYQQGHFAKFRLTDFNFPTIICIIDIPAPKYRCATY